MLNTEILCQTQTVDQFSDAGTITLRGKVARVRKPAWLVLTKLMGVFGMLILGLVFVPECIPFVSGPQAIAASLAVIVAYTVVAHVVHPKANTDNLGVLGVGDDKFQYRDDINRHLLALDVALGPGRFMASTMIDACTLAGILSERTQEDIEQSKFSKLESKRAKRADEIIARVAAQRQAKGLHFVELDPSRYFGQNKDEHQDERLHAGRTG